MDERRCTEPDCDKPHRARGLCSTHYNQSHQPDRHAKITVPCDYCGEPCEKERTSKFGARFCSLICRDLWRIDTGSNAKPPAHRPPPRSVVPASHPARWCGAVCAVLYGSCEDCGATIIQRGARRRCRPCAARKKYLRRCSRWSRRRVEVFMRGDWTCWLCGGRIDPSLAFPHPLAATVDHVLPVNHGGTDDVENLAPAHMTCNSSRGDSLQRVTLPLPEGVGEALSAA